MSRREKCTFDEKIKAVEDYLNRKRSQKQIALDLGLGKRGRSTVGLWVRKYQEAGPDALLPSLSKNAYTQELKEQVVREYLDGEGSMQALAIKYGIPNHHTVRDWISVYNSHKELKATSVHLTPDKFTLDKRKKPLYTRGKAMNGTSRGYGNVQKAAGG